MFPTVFRNPDLLRDQIKEFKFDIAKCTFTPGMALRAAAPSGLTSGPMVQGNAAQDAGDLLSFPRGTQVVDSFYDHADTNQGGFSFWICPEWDGDDGKIRRVFKLHANLRLYKDANGNFIFVWGKSSIFIPYDIESFAAGTWYHIVLLWDIDNYINGTDYAEMWIDGVNVAQDGDSATVQTSLANTLYLGCSETADQRVDSIIADYCITRNPGTMRGLISDLYNSGDGALAGDVIPAEDICFYQPASVAAGALTTGTGNALTFPMRADNELSNWHMQNATAGAPDNWTGEGGATLADAATADILLGTRAQKISVTGTGQRIYQDMSVSAGDNFFYAAWIKSNGANIARLRFKDQDNVADIVSQNVTSANWTLVTGSFEIPAGCSTVRVYAEPGNAATYDYHVQQVAVYPNLVDNGGMEGTYDDESGGGGGTVNVAPGWNNHNCETDGTDTLDKETTIVHSGSASQKVDVNAGGEGIRTAANVFASGTWYAVSLWLYASSGSVGIYDSAVSYLNETVTPSAAWTRYNFIVKATSARALLIAASGGAATFYVDDVSVIALNDITLTATAATLANSTEGGGVHVNGSDILQVNPVPVSSYSNERIIIETPITFKHGAADWSKFGHSQNKIIFWWDDVSNYISFGPNGASTLSATIVFGGTTIINKNETSVTGIDAGVKYLMRFEYVKGSHVKVWFGGVLKYNQTTTGTDDPADTFLAYWGSAYQTQELDAKFG